MPDPGNRPVDEPGSGPLRILIPGDTFPPNVNGAAKFTEQLAAGMAARGHEVHVVVPAASRRHGCWTEEYSGQRITAHRLPSYRWPWHDWLRFVLPNRARVYMRRILAEVRPHVVHSQSVVVLGRAASIEAQRLGIRQIMTNHLMLENVLDHSRIPGFLQQFVAKRWWRDVTETLARNAAVTTPTRRAAEFLSRNGGVEEVLAISCGIHTERYRPDFGPKPERRILFVGRVTGEKQLDTLLRAFRLLPTELGARLDVVGLGDKRRELEALAAELGIAERTSFHGYVSETALPGIYRRATVFAMPSTAELQSIATMEAMASGLPVVAADAMALPHLVHHGRTGLLVAPRDPQALAGALERVLRMPEEERQRMGRAGLQLVQMHDIERTLDLFERLYRGESVAEVARDSYNEQDRSLEDRSRDGADGPDESDAAAGGGRAA